MAYPHFSIAPNETSQQLCALCIRDIFLCLEQVAEQLLQGSLATSGLCLTSGLLCLHILTGKGRIGATVSMSVNLKYCTLNLR